MVDDMESPQEDVQQQYFNSAGANGRKRSARHKPETPSSTVKPEEEKPLPTLHELPAGIGSLIQGAQMSIPPEKL